MPPSQDRQQFRNEDLLLKVTKAIDRHKWDENKYEPFLDQLCDDREYQKEAIRTTLRYLLGQEYNGLRELAKANFDDESETGAACDCTGRTTLRGRRC